MVKKVETGKAPAAPGLLSQATVSNNLVFTSGQIHLSPKGELIEGSVEDQTRQVMSNLEAILEASGTGFENVLKANVFVTDMGIYKEFNDVYITYFKEPFPAREVVCVKELPLGARLEISMIAEIS